MSIVRQRNTRPELVLRAALRAAGVRGWRCHLKVPGTPDVAFSRWRVAVFVDGVWWHGHPDYLPRGRNGPNWDANIAKNRARDVKVNRLLRESGWDVVRIWDLDALADPHKAVRAVVSALSARGWVHPAVRLPVHLAELPA